MGLFGRLRGKRSGDSGRTDGPSMGVDRKAVRDHLHSFATTRRGVEAYVEPATNVTAESIVLVATDGEWTRRAVGSRKTAFELARSLDIPVYDVLLTGYPKRMRSGARGSAAARPDRVAPEGRRMTQWADVQRDVETSRSVTCQARARRSRPDPPSATKAKFREALDKKHAHAGMDVSADGEAPKVNEAHGPAKAQQMFRRKAGSLTCRYTPSPPHEASRSAPILRGDPDLASAACLT